MLNRKIEFIYIFACRCGKWLVRPTWNLCLTSANHLTLVINASVNFLIYCSVGAKFKGRSMRPDTDTLFILMYCQVFCGDCFSVLSPPGMSAVDLQTTRMSLFKEMNKLLR